MVNEFFDGFGGREGVYHQRYGSLLVFAINSVRVVTLTLAPVMVRISRDVDLVTGPPVGTERVRRKDAAVRSRAEHARMALAVRPQKRAARLSLQTAAVATHYPLSVIRRDDHAPSAVEAVHVVIVAYHFGGLAILTTEVVVAFAVVLCTAIAVDAFTCTVMEAVIGAVGARAEAARGGGGGVGKKGQRGRQGGSPSTHIGRRDHQEEDGFHFSGETSG